MNTKQLIASKKKSDMVDDPTIQLNQSKIVIQQYTDIKKCIVQFGFDNNGSMQLSLEIVENIMDEMRRDRKIRMVLNDENVEQYIKLDLNQMPPEDQQSEFERGVLLAKEQHREAFRQKMAILRLGYVFKMLKSIHGQQATMLNAETFKLKLIQLENRKQKSQYAVTRSLTQSKSQYNPGASMNDNPALMQAYKERQVQDPLLQELNSFIEVLRKAVVSEGVRQLKRINYIYQEYFEEFNMNQEKKQGQTPT